MALRKPLLSALVIGAGGPFSAEGPILQTGGAIGSVLGQWLPLSEREGRIVIACGAAAGMTGIFGTPLAAVVLPPAVLFAVEVTGDAHATIAVLAAVAVDTALADRLLPYNRMTGKLVRRGLHVSHDHFAPPARTTGASPHQTVQGSRDAVAPGGIPHAPSRSGTG